MQAAKQLYISIVFFVACFISLPNITMGAWNPFCSNKFLDETINNPNAFCKLQG